MHEIYFFCHSAWFSWQSVSGYQFNRTAQQSPSRQEFWELIFTLTSTQLGQYITLMSFFTLQKYLQINLSNFPSPLSLHFFFEFYNLALRNLFKFSEPWFLHHLQNESNIITIKVYHKNQVSALLSTQSTISTPKTIVLMIMDTNVGNTEIESSTSLCCGHGQ